MHHLPIQDIQAIATDNLVTHFTWVQRQTAGMHVKSDDKVVLTDSGLPCDTFNTLSRAHLKQDTVQADVQVAINYFAQAQRPFSWWLSPGDQPDNLAKVLLDAGLQEDYSEQAMAAGLSDLPSGDVEPNGLQIRRAQTPAELADFAGIISGMWSPPDPQVVRFYELAAPAILRPDSPMWFYVGYVEGTPAATGEATVHNGVVGLYNICTLPDFRQRGYGTAMTLQPLWDACAAKCHTAILQATEQGARVYKRLGFETFGIITEYKPPT